MATGARDRTCLAELVQLAIKVCQAAEASNGYPATEESALRPRPGRRPTFAHWQIAVVILVAVLNRRKSKSAQYRFLYQHRTEWMAQLGLRQFPTRSTYFRRYRLAQPLLQAAVQVQGRWALAQGLLDATTVAVDKTLVAARGPVQHSRPQAQEKPKPGVDRQVGWGYSQYDGWVWGYGLETVVTATPGSLVFPLLASVDPANRSEHRSFPQKVPLLPKAARYVLADAAYDSQAHQQAVERDAQDRPTGRRLLCPLILRAGKARVGRYPQRGQRGRLRQQRQQRLELMESPWGRELYARRTRTIEPFHEWFKSAFDLTDRVWHRGLANNRTQILAALVCYQLLVRYNHRLGRRNGRIQWLFDHL